MPISPGKRNPPPVDMCEQCGAAAEAYTHYDETTVYLCYDHAVDAGFCYTCGGFYGGTEEFFHTGIRGLCSECKSALDEGDF
jgi:hypothetical protein